MHKSYTSHLIYPVQFRPQNSKAVLFCLVVINVGTALWYYMPFVYCAIYFEKHALTFFFAFVWTENVTFFLITDLI